MCSIPGYDEYEKRIRLNMAPEKEEENNNNSAAPNRSHSEAERRRRKRINGHLSTLRSLLPNSTIKPDKASLLAEVVRSIREMKSVAAEMAANNEIMPSETDELKLCYCGGGNSSVIKVALSCDERKGLMGELAGSVRAVEGRVVRAEMATVGERTKNLLWVDMGGGAAGGGEEGMSVLRRAVRIGVDRAAAVCQVLPDNKRTRLSQY
ncbi:transcription factor bHLH30-like [Impatiens glandulifera]|uniref:transcription factor bHLH30-like n=1 Tax=Impatiens glandulifera TaxID=253017 RepID=UPI001FB15468|nr:transcription factor bHLH30-like [Impatiens glandulifera]